MSSPTPTVAVVARPIEDLDTRSEPRIRWTVFFHAPFDRVYALGTLGAMGVFLAGWAGVIWVQLAGAVIATVTLPWAARLTAQELKTPRRERGCVIQVDVLPPPQPFPYVDTVGDKRSRKARRRAHRHPGQARQGADRSITRIAATDADPDQ